MMQQQKDDNFIRLSFNILKTFFQYNSFQDLLAHNHAYRLSKDGKTMIESLRNSLEDNLKLGNRQQLEKQLQAFFKRLKTNPVTIYDVLFYFADHIIYPRCDTYRYRYEHTDIWRNYTRVLDEELVTAAVLLNETRRGHRREFPLDWSYCIKCDNAELMSMLNRDQGTSENHFHLRGSSPYLYISWVYLMNHVDNTVFEKNIEKLDKNRLTQSVSSIQKESLKLLWRKAAAIRLFLYSYVSETNHTFQNSYIDKDIVMKDIRKFGLSVNSNDSIFAKDHISIEKLKRYYLLTPDSLLQYKKHCLDSMYKWVCNDILNCDNLNIIPINQLQEEITACELLQGNQIDYAQVKGNKNQKYYHLQGERYLLTQVLRKIYFKTIGYERAENLLYLYLMMKHQFRNEMVQSNERKGFYNFSEFQDRKSLFVPWAFEEQLATHTIGSMIEDVKLYRAELRITPEETAKENAALIRMYDRAIRAAIKKAKESGQKELPKVEQFFYTYHFFKLEDKQHQELRCRNWECRIAAQRRADAILAIRAENADIAKRIYGIDACSSEVCCRPETFGSVFRRLQYYDPSVPTINHSNTHQLMATYHVGEDNFDIVDSMRAIDEAILFLQLRSGCRLGHATYLGVSPRIYYESIHSCISLPVQIWLDNCVWMYYFLKEHSIAFEGSSLLMNFLEEQFSIYFKAIYQNALTSGNMNYILEHIPESIYTDVPHNHEQCIFNLYHYYLSWMLRGDEPELYQSGYLKRPDSVFDEYKLCNSRDEMELGRDCFESTFLYYLYHFHKKTKMKGTEPVSVNIPDYYIKGVEEIQKVLREKIVHMGISIETNPTSNLFISTIRSYVEHPITAFYDYGLINNATLEQVNVSINTDDKSVFSTSLSNEYACLLFYLENQKDADGKKMYTRLQVMQWLNQIRIMGNEQSFSH